MKRISIIPLLLIPLLAVAKPGYKITLQVDGCKDSAVLMGYYMAQDRYVIDTAYNNGRGKFVFKGDNELLPGLYFFTNNTDRFVEFAVYHEKPNFTFRTDHRNWTTNMTVKGSHQNEVLFNYQRASDKYYQEMLAAKSSMDSADFAVSMQEPAESTFAYTIKKLPVTLRLSGDETLNLGGKGNRRHFILRHAAQHQRVRRGHLDDDFIIRTPKEIFYRRYNDYTDKYMRGLPPDRICPLLDTIIDRAEPAPEVYRWLINNLTEKYLQSNIMVYDEVYVHLVLRYFATGKVTWLSPSSIDMNVERATKWERLLVGREAPELILFDTLRRAHSLHRMPGRYTLLLFWSPTCGHCREVIPALYKAFNEVADSLDMTAFAILTEPDEVTLGKWKKFLADHDITNPRWVNLNGAEANVDWREVYDIETTPQVYLIGNKEHRFLAKKLNAQLFTEICKTLK